MREMVAAVHYYFSGDGHNGLTGLVGIIYARAFYKNFVPLQCCKNFTLSPGCKV